MKLDPKNLNVLAVSTSTSLGSVAVYGRGILLSEISWRRQGSHAELLVSHIEQALEMAALNPSDIGLVAVDIGPGSFTGVRVGVNAAKSWAYSMSVPVLGFSSLEIMAHELSPKLTAQMAVFINSQDGNFYWGVFKSQKASWKSGKSIISIPHQDLEKNLKKLKFSGLTDDREVLAKLISKASKSKLDKFCQSAFWPKASTLGRLALLKSSSSSSTLKTLDWKSLAPLYVRASSAEEKLKNSR